MIKTYNVAVKEIMIDTPDVKTVRFSLEGTGFTFKAGQFVMINVNLMKDNLLRKERRAYSISSSPDNKDYFDITVRKENGGKVSTFLHNLKKGDIIEIDGPYGHFTLDDDTKKVVYIGAGTGIAPLMSMARFACKNRLPIEQILIYTVRKAKDIIFKDEILEMHRRFNNIKTLITVTRPEDDDEWKGRTGRIDADLIMSLVKNLNDYLYYICGSPELVKGIKQILLNMMIDPFRVRQEVFVGTTD